MDLKQLGKSYYPHIYHYMQRRRFISKLPTKYKSDSSLTFALKDRKDGLFSLFFQALGALSVCEAGNHGLTLEYTDGPYIDTEKGENWWDYFFEYSKFGPQEAKNRIEVSALSEQYNLSFYGRNLPPKIGNKIIQKYNIKVKQDITDKVQTFKEKHLNDGPVIGIHYRGTDKLKVEAKKVPYEFILDYLSRLHKFSVVFVATDEMQFIEFLRSNFKGKVVCYDATRSDNGDPVHFAQTDLSMYKVGEEAVIDCLTLSSCNLLLRTESNLYRACSFFRPSQRNIDITREYMRLNAA